MKKIIMTTLAAGLVASAAVAEVSTTFDFASAYVFRGITFYDGASFQPGIEATGFGLDEKYGSVSVGAWGSADMGGNNSSTFQETDWYGSYGLPTFVENLDLSIGYTEYMYAAGISDKELGLSAGYAISDFSLFANWYQAVGGDISGSIYIDFGMGYDYAATEELSISAGARAAYAMRSDDPGYWGSMADESGFADYDVSLAAGYQLSEKWSASASIAYIGQLDDKVLADGAYDVDLVGMIGVACDM